MVQSINRLNCCFLGLLFLFIMNFQAFSNNQHQNIHLLVGESIIIEQKLYDLNLSRKGIVELFFTSQRKWQITGHKEGFVILTYVDQQDKKEKQIFLFVERRKVKNKKSNWSKGLPCSWSYVFCDEKRFD